VLQVRKQTFGVPKVVEAAEENEGRKAPTLNVTFFDAPSTVSTGRLWGTAMRELMGFCQGKGYSAGVPTGHVGTVAGKTVRGVFCLRGEGVKWFDAHQSFAWETDWGEAFRSIDSWCKSQTGWEAGVPNGHHAKNRRGCYCFKQGPFLKKYDVDITVERAGRLGDTPLISEFSYYNDNDWGKAMVTIGEYCRGTGWQWGFTNGVRSRYDMIRYDYVEAYCFKEA